MTRAGFLSCLTLLLLGVYATASAEETAGNTEGRTLNGLGGVKEELLNILENDKLSNINDIYQGGSSSNCIRCDDALLPHFTSIARSTGIFSKFLSRFGSGILKNAALGNCWFGQSGGNGGNGGNNGGNGGNHGGNGGNHGGNGGNHGGNGGWHHGGGNNGGWHHGGGNGGNKGK